MSGFVSGSCPVRGFVRVWVRVRVVFGFAFGSCLVRVRFAVLFVSGSCLVRIYES